MRLSNFRFLKKTDWASLGAAVILSVTLMVLPRGAKLWLGQKVVGTIFAPLEWPLSRARSLMADNPPSRRHSNPAKDQPLERTAQN